MRQSIRTSPELVEARDNAFRAIQIAEMAISIFSKEPINKRTKDNNSLKLEVQDMRREIDFAFTAF